MTPLYALLFYGVNALHNACGGLFFPRANSQAMRTIVCGDAVRWLQTQADHTVGHIVTALPDMHDVGMTATKYEAWFERVCRLFFQKVAPAAYVIFCQTDRKIDGRWWTKSAVVHRVAKEAGIPLRWHKIVVRREGTDLHRPTYSHLLCFSFKGGPGSATPDVFPSGPVVYRDGMGLGAVAFVMRFLAASRASHLPVIDPFVGRGTVVAAAEAFGAESVGVDVSESQCAHARALRLRRTRSGELERA